MNNLGTRNKLLRVSRRLFCQLKLVNRIDSRIWNCQKEEEEEYCQVWCTALTGHWPLTQWVGRRLYCDRSLTRPAFNWQTAQCTQLTAGQASGRAGSTQAPTFSHSVSQLTVYCAVSVCPSHLYSPILNGLAWEGSRTHRRTAQNYRRITEINEMKWNG